MTESEYPETRAVLVPMPSDLYESLTERAESLGKVLPTLILEILQRAESAEME